MAHPNSLAGLSATIQMWIERSRQRRALGELVERNDRHLLADIGLSAEQARREANKPFWVPSKKASSLKKSDDALEKIWRAASDRSKMLGRKF